MELLEEINERFSASDFTGESVAHESIARILEAGRLAPSAKNRQPWRFIVIQSDEKKEAFKEASYGLEKITQADSIIALCTTSVNYKMSNGQISYPIDCSIAASFMMLQAEHEKLGSCLVSTYDENQISQLLSIPYSMRVVLLLLIGQKTSNQKIRRRLDYDRVISFEHW